jgi:hypothetical protein
MMRTRTAPCTGRLIHVDRIPGSMWGLTAWDDFYECADCGAQLSKEVVLSEIPWGELRDPEPGSTIRATVVVRVTAIIVQDSPGSTLTWWTAAGRWWLVQAAATGMCA